MTGSAMLAAIAWRSGPLSRDDRFLRVEVRSDDLERNREMREIAGDARRQDDVEQALGAEEGGAATETRSICVGVVRTLAA